MLKSFAALPLTLDALYQRCLDRLPAHVLASGKVPPRTPAARRYAVINGRRAMFIGTNRHDRRGLPSWTAQQAQRTARMRQVNRAYRDTMRRMQAAAV